MGAKKLMIFSDGTANYDESFFYNCYKKNFKKSAYFYCFSEMLLSCQWSLQNIDSIPCRGVRQHHHPCWLKYSDGIPWRGVKQPLIKKNQKSGIAWLVGWLFCFTAYQPFSGHLTQN